VAALKLRFQSVQRFASPIHNGMSANRCRCSIDGLPLPFVDQIRDIVVYHDCRLKYDKQICLIVHNAYKRAVLLLKCFHTRERDILKLAFITYIRPLLEFFGQIWAPKYNYCFIDKIESVQKFFYKKNRAYVVSKSCFTVNV